MPLKIGIIGTGFIGGQHARCLKSIDSIEVTAVASLTVEMARAFCKEKQLTEATPYGDAMELIEKAQVDAVYFCMPPFAHAGEVQAAAKRGLHLFLEKPIALNSSLAEDMVQAIEEAGVLSQVGFMMRFSQAAQALKAKLKSGEVGRPTLFSGRFWVNTEGSGWWRDRSRSGGQIFEQIIHLYDLARYFCGPVESAQGTLANILHTGKGDYTIEDTSVGLVNFENGALASITGSNCAVPMHFFADYRVACEKGTLEYRCYGQPWVKPDEATYYPLEGEAETLTQTRDCFLEEDRHFVECLLKQTPTLCPAREGLEAIRLVEQVIQS